MVFPKKLVIYFLIVQVFISCTLQFGKVENQQRLNAGEQKTVADNDIDYSQIGPGDMLQINVYGEKELTGLYQVSPEGSIAFPFIGEIGVKNLSNFTLSEKISKMLKDGFIKDPQVTVFIKEFQSKRVYVLGQVKNAGKFMIMNEMSVIEAISMAGGFTNLADISNVIVTRRDDKGVEQRYTLNIDDILKGKEKNFYLRAGDMIYVNERFF